MNGLRAWNGKYSEALNSRSHTTGDLLVMEIIDCVVSDDHDGGEAALGVRNPSRTL